MGRVSLPISKIAHRIGSVVVAAFAGLLVLSLATGVAAAQGIATDQITASDFKAPNNNPSIGMASAPVTMEIWFDYQCPYCRLLWRDALPRVVSKYVASGRLRIIFKDFEFLGEDSVTTALVGRAVWDLYPQRFFEWNIAVFATQGGENEGWASLKRIIELSSFVLGLDGSKLSAQLEANRNRYARAIEADMTEARVTGVEGTPTIFIESRPLDGLYSYENISAVIDKALIGEETVNR